MKQHKKSLNSKGFSHLEILLVIALVVVIALAGLFVYKHDHKNSTAHAGTGWTWLIDYIVTGEPGQSGRPLINIYACLEKINTPSGTYYNVEGLATSNIRVSGYLSPGIFDSIAGGWSTYSSSWNNQQVRMSHSVDIGIENRISPSLGLHGGRVTTGTHSNVGVHALALAKCAG